METINDGGVIGIVEDREQINKIKEFYKDEYQKIKDEQKEMNAKYSDYKWKVRFGSLGVKAGMSFFSKPVKVISRVFTNILSGISKKVIDLRKKLYNQGVEKRLKQLDADFINLEGDFKQFTLDYSENINSQESSYVK